MMSRLVDEFRAIPWNSRGRKAGRILEQAGIVLLLAAPIWMVLLIETLVGP